LLIKNYGILSDKMQQAFETENETGEIENTVIIEAETEETPVTEAPPAVEKSEEEIMRELGFDTDPIPEDQDAPLPVEPPYHFDPSIKPSSEMMLPIAESITSKVGKPYKELSNTDLEWHFRGCNKELEKKRETPLADEKRAELELKRDAAATVYVSRQVPTGKEG
jgi:hypothetical protein